jgi:regulator of protease activity HflC (stomatin/prohibitin superfamily)
MTLFLTAFVVSFVGCSVVVSGLLWLGRLLGVYAVVMEGTAHVYTLFGKVRAVLTEPGLYFLWGHLGLPGVVINLFGTRYIVDTRLEQTYLRSQPVNSEEGAPMGIGVWYEMRVSDPVAYLFKNANPRGSLAANVSSATVRCLSNMRLADMLEDRHPMSQSVRTEVSPKSHEWGFELGSVYIRKVHFRDRVMIRQIEEKVVNRLRQITSAIKQDGANQVNIITSTADREAAVEFAKAAAIRPHIVGEALQTIAADPEVLRTLFEVLETEGVLAGPARVTLIPPASRLLAEGLAVLASKGAAREGGANPVCRAEDPAKEAPPLSHSVMPQPPQIPSIPPSTQPSA